MIGSRRWRTVVEACHDVPALSDLLYEVRNLHAGRHHAVSFGTFVLRGLAGVMAAEPIVAAFSDSFTSST